MRRPQHVLSGFAGLGVHPDVPEGVRLLRRHGLRLVTLTNGSADVADRLLAKAGIRGEFERLLSVEDADAWKPAPAAYAHAARACSASTDQVLLVAVHPWDIHGAHQAGVHAGWITRQQDRTPTTSPPRTCKPPAWRPWPGRSSPDSGISRRCGRKASPGPGRCSSPTTPRRPARPSAAPRRHPVPPGPPRRRNRGRWRPAARRGSARARRCPGRPGPTSARSAAARAG